MARRSALSLAAARIERINAEDGALEARPEPVGMIHARQKLYVGRGATACSHLAVDVRRQGFRAS